HPEGLEDVSKYPAVIQTLLDRGWSEEELRGVLRENFLRVFREVEQVRDAQASEPVNEEEINLELVANECRLELKPVGQGLRFTGLLAQVFSLGRRLYRIFLSEQNSMADESMKVLQLYLKVKNLEITVPN
ncbi:UNVERIFIED_CONTAM: hypothetical protein K2H54_031361, partial [Gekko kuhli]